MRQPLKIALLVVAVGVFAAAVLLATYVRGASSRLERKAERVFQAVEQGEKSLKESLRVERVGYTLQDEIPNPHAQYPAYRESGPTFANLQLSIQAVAAQRGRYKIVAIYKNPGNGLKSWYEKEMELSAGTQEITVVIPASSAQKDVGAWYAKMPRGSVEVIVYKWTTEKELIGFELSQSTESKQPAFWEVARGEFPLE